MSVQLPLTIVAGIGFVAVILVALDMMADIHTRLNNMLRQGGCGTVQQDVKIIQAEALHIHDDPTAPDESLLPLVEQAHRHRKGG